MSEAMWIGLGLIVVSGLMCVSFMLGAQEGRQASSASGPSRPPQRIPRWTFRVQTLASRNSFAVDVADPTDLQLASSYIVERPELENLRARIDESLRAIDDVAYPSKASLPRHPR